MPLNPRQIGGDSGVDAGKPLAGTFVSVGDQSDQHEIVGASSG